MHRPGPELRWLASGTKGQALRNGPPWLARAQREHDHLAGLLEQAGVRVLHVTALLAEVLQGPQARSEAIASATAGPGLGEDLRSQLREHLDSLAPQALAVTLVRGLTRAEFATGGGVVYALTDPHGYVLRPLAGLVFTKDSCTWVGDRVAVASLLGSRRGESEVAGLIFRHHPEFAGHEQIYHPGLEPLHGGDVLLLAPGAVAVGVGARTSPAAAERLARNALATGQAHTVLAVPMSQDQCCGHLDLACTVVAPATVLMRPALAYSLTALVITARGGRLRVERPRPFLEAVGQATGTGRVTVIGAGLDPLTGSRQEWDDGSNALVLGEGTVLSSERDAEANARLRDAGLKVVEVPDGELGGRRGGPRGLCAVIAREPAEGRDQSGSRDGADQSVPLHGEPAGMAASVREESVREEEPGDVPARVIAESARAPDGGRTVL